MTHPIVLGYDIVNPATGTARHQINNEKIHNIPVGSVVKVLFYDSEKEQYYEHPQGKILNVVDHGRDCDGTPLYYLHFKTIEELLTINDLTMNLINQLSDRARETKLISQRTYGGVSEESLKLIALPQDVIPDL